MKPTPLDLSRLNQLIGYLRSANQLRPDSNIQAWVEGMEPLRVNLERFVDSVLEEMKEKG